MKLFSDSVGTCKTGLLTTLAVVFLLGMVSGQESISGSKPPLIDPVMKTPEFAILKKLWSAYQGEIPRSEVNSLLSKGWGDEIFKLRVGLEGWLRLLPEPEWIEHCSKGEGRRWGQSELKARLRLPGGVYQVAFIFAHDANTGEIKFHDLWMAEAFGDRKQFWILQNDEVIKRCQEEYEKIQSAAKVIAGETSNYDRLSENLSDFRKLAVRLNLLDNKETKEFLIQGDSLVSFGAGWNQTMTKTTEETFKSGFSSQFVVRLQVQLKKTGGKLDAEAKETVKRMVEQEVQARQQSTIQKLNEAQATRLDSLKKSLSSSYETFLKLLNR